MASSSDDDTSLEVQLKYGTRAYFKAFEEEAETTINSLKKSCLDTISKYEADGTRFYGMYEQEFEKT